EERSLILHGILSIAPALKPMPSPTHPPQPEPLWRHFIVVATRQVRDGPQRADGTLRLDGKADRAVSVLVREHFKMAPDRREIVFTDLPGHAEKDDLPLWSHP